MPNIVNTKVDSDRLSAAARNIEDCLRLAENALKAVNESLISNLKPTWSGPASTQFFDQYTKDEQSFTSLMRNLRDYNEKLKRAAGTYDSADSSASDLVRQIQVTTVFQGR